MFAELGPQLEKNSQPKVTCWKGWKGESCKDTGKEKRTLGRVGFY